MEKPIEDALAFFLTCLTFFSVFMFFHIIASLIRESKMSNGWLYPEDLYSFLNDDLYSATQKIIGGRRVPGGVMFRDQNLMRVFVSVANLAGHCDTEPAEKGKLEFRDKGYTVRVGEHEIRASNILRPEYKRLRKVEELYNGKG